MIDITKQAIELMLAAMVPQIGVQVVCSHQNLEISDERISVTHTGATTDVEGEDGQPLIATHSVDITLQVQRNTEEFVAFQSLLFGALREDFTSAKNALEFPFSSLNVLRVKSPSVESDPRFDNGIATVVYAVEVMAVTLLIEETEV